MAETFTLTAQCLCKTHTFTTPLPKTSLSLAARSCHCTSCRHTTGALYYTAIEWPGAIAPIANSSLASYKFTNIVTLRFCSTCSSLIAFHLHPPKGSKYRETIMVGIGVLSNTHPDMIQVTDHIFVGDTLDGGATPWLLDLCESKDQPKPRRWMGWQRRSEELPLEWAPKRILDTDRDKIPDEVSLHCRCKGVNLILKRGRYTDGKLPWFVEPTSPKLLAGFDACHSCRTSFSGTDIANWTFSLLENIDFAEPANTSGPSVVFPDNSISLKTAVDEKADARFGTLSYYESSDDVQRYFCSSCSASVFYAVDDRPEMVDVGIGLLDSPCGARADSLLEYSFGTMIWTDDCKGGWREQLVNAVKRNTEAYRIQNDIPKAWVRVAKEKQEAEKATA